MRRNVVRVMMVLFVAAVLGMTGCGGGGSSSVSNDNVGDVINDNVGDSDGAATHPYFMTTVGSSWTYSDGKTEKVIANSNGALTLESVDGIYKDIITAVVSGTAIAVSQATSYENNVSQGTTTMSPAWKIFPSSTTTGFTETQTVTETFPGGSESSTSTLTVIGIETVTVPAGTFPNSIKIQRQDSFDNIYFWLAPGVGSIKEVDATDNTVLRQLVSYTTGS